MDLFSEGLDFTLFDGEVVTVGTNKLSPQILLPKFQYVRGIGLYLTKSTGTADIQADLITVTPGKGGEEWPIAEMTPISTGFSTMLVTALAEGDVLTHPSGSAAFSAHVQCPIPGCWAAKLVATGSGTATCSLYAKYWF